MRTQLVAMVLATLALSPGITLGAPCVTACKNEIRSCVSEQCQGLKPGPRRRCRRKQCARPIVTQCYKNLSLCGATRARPAPPSAPHPVPSPY